MVAARMRHVAYAVRFMMDLRFLHSRPVLLFVKFVQGGAYLNVLVGFGSEYVTGSILTGILLGRRTPQSGRFRLL